MLHEPIYNRIGKTYDMTRSADSIIATNVTRLLRANSLKRYLDIGCGSGNYTCALNLLGLTVDGIDISKEMLEKARLKNPDIQWHQSDVQSLPFSDHSYDGAFCILATHHFKNIEKAFKEVFRVIYRGTFVIFTSTPDQMQYYWLWYYFPKMMQASCEKMASFHELASLLAIAGFTHVNQEAFFVTNDLRDLFLQAGKYRPEIYLNPHVREGISSFQLSACQEELKMGLNKLEQDIHSGRINSVIQNYENNLGDYCFITAEK